MGAWMPPCSQPPRKDASGGSAAVGPPCSSASRSRSPGGALALRRTGARRALGGRARRHRLRADRAAGRRRHHPHPRAERPGRRHPERQRLRARRSGSGCRPPVLVWIHGGGYTSGSPASRWYDGDAFARDGVITVVISYRIGFDGFGLIEGTPANRGLRDQIAALSGYATRSRRRSAGSDPRGGGGAVRGRRGGARADGEPGGIRTLRPRDGDLARDRRRRHRRRPAFQRTPGDAGRGSPPIARDSRPCPRNG